MKKIIKHLKTLGWVRDKSMDQDECKFLHLKGSDYSLYVSEKSYYLSDDSDVMDDDDVPLTLERIDELYNNYINDGVKSY
jgi:hypothetical protein